MYRFEQQYCRLFAIVHFRNNNGELS